MSCSKLSTERELRPLTGLSLSEGSICLSLPRYLRLRLYDRATLLAVKQQGIATISTTSYNDVDFKKNKNKTATQEEPFLIYILILLPVKMDKICWKWILQKPFLCVESAELYNLIITDATCHNTPVGFL